MLWLPGRFSALGHAPTAWRWPWGIVIPIYDDQEQKTYLERNKNNASV
jgi:hypothetical protein